MPRIENIEADLLSKIFLGGLLDHLTHICKREIVHSPRTESLLVAMVSSVNVRTPTNLIEDLKKYIVHAELPPNPM